MALTFGAATSDRVSLGSAAGIDDLTEVTWVLWVYVTTRTSGRCYAGKGAKSFYAADASGNITIEHGRATTSMSATSTGGPIAANTWYCLAGSLSQSGNAGKIYVGSLTSSIAEVSYASTAAGSGAYTTEASDNLLVGNYGAGTTYAIQGRIGPYQYYNRVLSIGEIKDLQYTMHYRRLSGCVAWVNCGDNGTSTQPDLSGNGNAGTVTGATASANPPLPRRGLVPRFPYVVAAAAGPNTRWKNLLNSEAPITSLVNAGLIG